MPLTSIFLAHVLYLLNIISLTFHQRNGQLPTLAFGWKQYQDTCPVISYSPTRLQSPRLYTYRLGKYLVLKLCFLVSRQVESRGLPVHQLRIPYPYWVARMWFHVSRALTSSNPTAYARQGKLPTSSVLPSGLAPPNSLSNEPCN